MSEKDENMSESGVISLLKENAELKNDLKYLQDLVNGNAREALIHSASFEGGEFNALLEHPLFGLIAQDLTNYFIEIGAENYMWMKLHSTKANADFVLTVKKDSGLSPEEKNERLEARIAELEAERDEQAKLIDQLVWDSGDLHQFVDRIKELEAQLAKRPEVKE